MGYLAEGRLRDMGFRRLGQNVRVSDRCAIYNAERISIGSNSRIDDFAILSAGRGGIEIGRHVHIGAHTAIVGNAAIRFADFSGVSLHCSIFSSSDDFSVGGLINPTVAAEFRFLIESDVIFERYSTLGANSVMLPGAVLGEGTVVGALSLVKSRLEPWGVCCGNPARRVKDRPKGDIAAHAEEQLRRLGAEG